MALSLKMDHAVAGRRWTFYKPVGDGWKIDLNFIPLIKKCMSFRLEKT